MEDDCNEEIVRVIVDVSGVHAEVLDYMDSVYKCYKVKNVLTDEEVADEPGKGSDRIDALVVLVWADSVFERYAHEMLVVARCGLGERFDAVLLVVV